MQCGEVSSLKRLLFIEGHHTQCFRIIKLFIYPLTSNMRIEMVALQKVIQWGEKIGFHANESSDSGVRNLIPCRVYRRLIGVKRCTFLNFRYLLSINCHYQRFLK